METELKINKLLKTIQETDKSSPELYDMSLKLSYAYAKLAEEYVSAKEEVDILVFTLVEQGKTVAAAEKEIAVTEDGKKAFRLKMKLKSIEKILSNLKDIKKKIQNEVYNQY